MTKFIAAILLMSCVGTCSSQVNGQRTDRQGFAWPRLEGFVINTQKLEVASDASETPLQLEPMGYGLSPRQFYADRLAAPLDFEKDKLRPGIYMHHYSKVSVVNAPAKSVMPVDEAMKFAHYRATGTYVYYLSQKNIFYLWGGCAMNHTDQMVGPFAGDPRIVLKRYAKEIKREGKQKKIFTFYFPDISKDFQRYKNLILWQTASGV